MVIGNVDKQGSEELVKLVDETFPFSPLEEGKRSHRRPVQLPLSPMAEAATSVTAPLAAATTPKAAIVDITGSTSTTTSGSTSSSSSSGYRISRTEPNDQDDNSAVTFYFQMPSRK
jgi:hypothetical protein